MISAQIIETDDGSSTLIHPLLGQMYHSSRGAEGESMHVFIKNGFQYINKYEISVFEVGFGSGLNALMTLIAADNKKVDYHAVEIYPLDMETINGLSYAKYPEFLSLHTAEWNVETAINDRFRLTKIEKSLLDIEFSRTFDVIYFDAFDFDSQPDMWSLEVFKKLFDATSYGGILVTYSSKGVVKQRLRDAGYQVSRLEGALGKRHMIRAQKL